MSDVTIENLLERLNAAPTEKEREWLVLQLTLNGLTPDVREALWAAAVPHSFDISLLAALLQCAEDKATPLYKALCQLSLVEPFPGTRHNVHERSRDLLLERLWADDRPRFQELHNCAYLFYAERRQDNFSQLVEYFYHWLLSGQDEHLATEEFSSKCIALHNSFAYHQREALVQPLEREARAGRLIGEAAAWSYLFTGQSCIQYSDNFAAKEVLTKALPLSGRNKGLKANCIQALGDVHYMLDEYELAHGRYQEAQPLYREIGDKLGEANCIQALGDVHRMLDEYELARGRYQEAQPLYREIGAKVGEANCIKALGDVHYMLSEYELARGRYQEAQPLYREIGAKVGEANCIKALGELERSLKDYAQARKHFAEAIECYGQMGNRFSVANTRHSLGDLLLDLEDYAGAEEHFAAALEASREIPSPLLQAWCLLSLGNLAQARRQYAPAQDYYQEAGEIFARIGLPANADWCAEKRAFVENILYPKPTETGQS